MNFHTHIIRTFALTTFILGLVALANWYIDPYGYWGRLPFGTYQDGTFRDLKARVISRGNYKTLLFGASTTVGTDPDSISGCNIYNAAFNGQRPTEILYIMRNFVTDDTKTIIIAFDFFFFNQATEAEYINPNFGKYSLKDILAYTVSSTTIKQSHYTLREWRRIKNGTRKIGSAINPNGQREAKSIIEADAARTEYDFAKEIKWFHQGFLNNYNLSSTQTRALSAIKEEAANKGIKLVVAINPLSEFMFSYIHEKEMGKDFAQFRALVKSVFPEVIDLSQSEFSNNLGFLKNDPVHFHPDTGAAVLKHITAQSKACS